MRVEAVVTTTLLVQINGRHEILTANKTEGC